MSAETTPRAPSRLRGRAVRSAPFVSAALAFVAYVCTAARTITWWDGSSYPLAAVTLGVPGAPGSLLLTILGWIVSRIPIVHPVAFRLNLFAALLAATLVGLVSWLGARLATPEGGEPGGIEAFAGALAGLTFAFVPTPWTYAVQFTPYGLSALWTALILLAVLAWWRRSANSSGRAELFVIFLLLGLDLSVHRTNWLLFPAVLLWLSIRSPRAKPLRDGGAAAAGLVLGLAFHLLLIPIAARRPSYMDEDPSTWAGWWSYVTIEEKGGGFLVKLLPRNASFFSFQMADYLRFLGRSLSPLLFLPAVFAALGWLLIVRHHPRRGVGLMAFFMCAGPGAVVYFNLPQHYMRPIDRHYLPSLVILAPWIAVGAAALLRGTLRLPGRAVLAPGLAVAMALTPVDAWRSNHRRCDLSRTRFTESFARDLLEPLPDRAVLLTNGDNDTLPLWYLQQVEAVRRDVMVVNLPLTNTGNYVAQLRRGDRDLATLLGGEPLPTVLKPRPASGGSVTMVVEPRTGLGLPPGVRAPEFVQFQPTGRLYGPDLVALDLLRLTRWRRPVFLACTVAPDYLAWLWPYARLDGLGWRIVPSTDPSVHDVDHLRAQLLQHVSYAGVADTTIVMDADSRAMCSCYLAELSQLAAAESRRGRPLDALATLRFIEVHTPPARLGVDPGQIAALRAQFEAEAAKAGRSSSH